MYLQICKTPCKGAGDGMSKWCNQRESHSYWFSRANFDVCGQNHWPSNAKDANRRLWGEAIQKPASFSQYCWAKNSVMYLRKHWTARPRCEVQRMFSPFGPSCCPFSGKMKTAGDCNLADADVMQCFLFQTKNRAYEFVITSPRALPQRFGNSSKCGDKAEFF